MILNQSVDAANNPKLLKKQINLDPLSKQYPDVKVNEWIERDQRHQNMTVDFERGVDSIQFNNRYCNNNDYFQTKLQNSITYYKKKLSQVKTCKAKRVFKIDQNPSAGMDRSESGITRRGYGKYEKIILPKQRTLFIKKDAVFTNRF